MKYFLLIAGSLAAGIIALILLLVLGETKENAATMGFCVFGAIACFGYSSMLGWIKCPNCDSRIRARSTQCPNCKTELAGHSK